MKNLCFRGAGRLAGFIALASLCIAVTASPAWTAERMLNGRGLLWKVEREGTQPSWVFGTMHVSDDRLSAYGVGEKQLDRFKPWAALNFLGPLSPEPARSEPGNVFLDHYLQLVAAERGARVFALETPKEQLDVFDGMSERHQVDMLRHALRRKSRGKHEFERMVELYLKSDVAAILGEVMGRKVKCSEFVRVFNRRTLDSRNKTMVKRMAPRPTEGNALIAVGAAHLPGRVGILNLLAKEGHTVARVY